MFDGGLRESFLSDYFLYFVGIDSFVSLLFVMRWDAVWKGMYCDVRIKVKLMAVSKLVVGVLLTRRPGMSEDFVLIPIGSVVNKQKTIMPHIINRAQGSCACVSCLHFLPIMLGHNMHIRECFNAPTACYANVQIFSTHAHILLRLYTLDPRERTPTRNTAYILTTR